MSTKRAARSSLERGTWPERPSNSQSPRDALLCRIPTASPFGNSSRVNGGHYGVIPVGEAVAIALSGGGFALCDSRDAELLAAFHWTARKAKSSYYGVARRSMNPGRVFDNRGIHMHRLIMGVGLHDLRIVHHKNGNGLDNRRCNLRLISRRDHVLLHNAIRMCTGAA